MDTVINPASGGPPQLPPAASGGASAADWDTLIQATNAQVTPSVATTGGGMDSDAVTAVAVGTALGKQIAAGIETGNAGSAAPASDAKLAGATSQMLALTLTARPNGDVSPAPVILPPTPKATTAGGGRAATTITTSADGKTTAQVVAAVGDDASPVVVATVSTTLDPSAAGDPTARNTAALAAGLAARSADAAIAAAPVSSTQSAADIARQWADAYLKTYTAWVVALTTLYGGGGTASEVTVTTTDTSTGAVTISSAGQAAGEAAESTADKAAKNAQLAASLAACLASESENAALISRQAASSGHYMTPEDIQVRASILTLWTQGLTMGLVTPSDTTDAADDGNKKGEPAFLPDKQKLLPAYSAAD